MADRTPIEWTDATRTPMTPQQLRARAARLIAQAEAMEQQETD